MWNGWTTVKPSNGPWTGSTKQRDEIVAEYRKLIQTDEDREAFDGAYNTIRTIYRYAEDHLFWVEHWFHTIWFDKIRKVRQSCWWTRDAQ